MNLNIYPITLGFDHCYVIRDKGTIMVDGGAPKELKEFTKAIEELSIKPQDIQLMIMTHGHWDHIGSAKEIKDLTGAKIAMHAREKDWLEKSLKPMPPGVTLWGHIFCGIIKMLLPLVKIPPTDVDLVIGDEGLSLDEYGIPGKVIYTPGHSSGSVSVVLETGDAFVGDLAMNKFPLRLSPGLPIFAEDWSALKDSWQLLFDHGAKTIYPAHGEPFSVDIIRKALQ
jgi:glyoxylase-like metal-dependent hydrolase (beta-lactamase superfamily II)